MPIPRSYIPLALLGATMPPLAFMAGRQTAKAEQKPFQVQLPAKTKELMKAIGQDIGEYTQPAELAGAGAGSLVGAMIAQHMRQPLSPGARRVPLTKRPEELIPGAMGGAGAGAVIANLIRKSMKPLPEAELDPYAV